MAKSKTPATPELPHHFFASTAVSWGVGQTRQEAIDKAARIAGSDIIKRNVKANGGLYVWTCEVECPQSTDYNINNYAPSTLIDPVTKKDTNVAVPIHKTMEFLIANVKGDVRIKA